MAIDQLTDLYVLIVEDVPKTVTDIQHCFYDVWDDFATSITEKFQPKIEVLLERKEIETFIQDRQTHKSLLMIIFDVSIPTSQDTTDIIAFIIKDKQTSYLGKRPTIVYTEHVPTIERLGNPPNTVTIINKRERVSGQMPVDRLHAALKKHTKLLIEEV